MKTLLAALGCTALLAGCAVAPVDHSYGYATPYGYGSPYAYGYDYGPYYNAPAYYGYYDNGPTFGFSYYGGHYHDGHYHHYHAYDGNHWHPAASSGSVGRGGVATTSRAYVAGAAHTRVTAAAPARLASGPHHIAGSNVAAAPRHAPSVAHARVAPEHDHS